MRQLLVAAYHALPAGGHRQLVTIPGLGEATAAALTAKIIDIERFATPEQLVADFGVFPDEHTSGVDKAGKPLPAGTLRMSAKGNDLVRHYLWNAARSAITHNPAIRALYRRLRARGTRGDVAIGHCMRKLLHLVFALWKTGRPFDPQHSAWEPAGDTTASIPTIDPKLGVAPPAVNDTTVGHTREIPAQQVVTTATASVAPAPAAVNAPVPAAARPRIDYAFLRQQVTLEQVLRHLGLLDQLHGRGLQRRGPCPIHAEPTARAHTFSAHLGKNVFQCFHADCAAHWQRPGLLGRAASTTALRSRFAARRHLPSAPEQRRGTRKLNPFARAMLMTASRCRHHARRRLTLNGTSFLALHLFLPFSCLASISPCYGSFEGLWKTDPGCPATGRSSVVTNSEAFWSSTYRTILEEYLNPLMSL